MPPRAQGHYDWLITGLGILHEKGDVELSYDGQSWNYGLASKFSRRLADLLLPVDHHCLTAEVESGGRIVSLALDIKKAPFEYDTEVLESVDLYFKCQCPIQFETQGFRLNRHVRIPYPAEVFAHQHKIRPAMLGRPLANTTDLRKNLRVLRDWETTVGAWKDIRLFASFPKDEMAHSRNGSSGGAHLVSDQPWSGKVHLPTLKRGRIVETLRRMEKGDIDAREWSGDNSGIPSKLLSTAEYARKLRRSVFHVNISGLQRAAPFRIIDTLLTGGTVVTDNLAVRWHREFDREFEVREIGDFGYEREEDVDWNGVEQKLAELYEWAGGHSDIGPCVQELYRQKWAPQVFARYVLGECGKVMEGRE